MKKRSFLSCRRIFPAFIMLVLVLGVHTGTLAAPYFEGKIIKFVVSFSAGGGTDIFARMVSRHLGKFVPGKPKIVIRNIPGGGGVIGANFAWSAKPDGKTILATAGTNVMSNILRPKGSDFLLQEMQPIYSSPSGLVYYASTKLISESKDFLTVKGVIFGHDSITGGPGGGFIWAIELLGLKPEKLIWGYGGGGPSRLAFISGETNTCGESTLGYNSAMKPYVEKGEAIPIYQSGILDENGNVVREPSAPDVPTPNELYEQIHGKKPSGHYLEAYKLLVGSRTYGKALLLPKNTPADIVDIFHQAVARMNNDPIFLKESEKLNPGAPHFFGKRLIRNYPAGVSGSEEIVEFMKKILREKYKVVLD